MEIRDLNYFRTVVDAGGVTAAADLLHMTPGALSKALKRFQEELGYQVLKRSGRNLIMTDVGKRLYDASPRFLKEHERLYAELAAVADPVPSMLRIASFEPFTSAFAAELLATQLPDAEAEILEMLVGDIERAVVDGRVDYGLSYVPFPNRELAFRRLGRLEMGVFGLADAFEGVPFSELPFAIPINRVRLASGERMGIDGWPSQRFPRKVKYRLVTMQSSIELALCGLAVLVIPRHVVALHNRNAKRSRRLVRWPNPKGMGRIYRQAHLICRANDRDEARTRELAAAMKKTLTAVNALPIPTR